MSIKLGLCWKSARAHARLIPCGQFSTLQCYACIWVHPESNRRKIDYSVAVDDDEEEDDDDDDDDVDVGDDDDVDVGDDDDDDDDDDDSWS